MYAYFAVVHNMENSTFSMNLASRLLTRRQQQNQSQVPVAAAGRGGPVPRRMPSSDSMSDAEEDNEEDDVNGYGEGTSEDETDDKRQHTRRGRRDKPEEGE